MGLLQQLNRSGTRGHCRWFICGGGTSLQQRQVESTMYRERWRVDTDGAGEESPFILKHCHLFLHMKKKFPRHKAGILVKVTSGCETSMDQVQANCSIEGWKLKGITAASKKPLAKHGEERQHLQQLTSINNGLRNGFPFC